MARKKHKTSAASAGSSASKPRKSESEVWVSPKTVLKNKISLQKWHDAYGVIPAVLALLTSVNTLWNGFAFDDTQQILRNEFIKRFDNLPVVFTNSVWSFNPDSLLAASVDSYYRPLFMTLFTINYSVFGTVAWGWHLVNVLIHAAVTLMVFFVLRELTERKTVAAIAAGFFVIHPAHAESVAWISGVTDPLMALFLLPAFYCYMRFRKSGRKTYMALSVALFLPALFSKETALAMPLVIAYLELFYFRDLTPLWRRVVRAATLVSLFSAPTAIYFALRYIALGHKFLPTEARFSVGLVLATIPVVIVRYLELMLIPIGYSLQHYVAPEDSVLSLSFLGPLALLVAMVVAVWLVRSRVLAFAGVWFFIWLLPPLAGLRSFEPQYFVQERYLYLPSIGICLALAMGVEWLAARRPLNFSGVKVAAVAAASLLVIWSVVSIKQNRVWNDTLSLLRHSAATNPTSPQAHVTLSTEYYIQGKRQEAEEETRKALELEPSCLDAIINLSQFAYNAGQLDPAIEYLEQARDAVGEGPQRRGYLARVHHDLGMLYAEQKKPDLAESCLKQSVEILPYPKYWLALGDFYFDNDRHQEALEMYELTQSKTSPKYALLHLKLGRTYDRLGQVERARAEYNKYLDLAPNAKDRNEVFRRLMQL